MLLLAGGKHGGRREVHPGPPLQSHPPPGSRSRAGSALRPAPNPALSSRPPDNGHYTRVGGGRGAERRGGRTKSPRQGVGGAKRTRPSPPPPLSHSPPAEGARRGAPPLSSHPAPPLTTREWYGLAVLCKHRVKGTGPLLKGPRSGGRSGMGGTGSQCGVLDHLLPLAGVWMPGGGL